MAVFFVSAMQELGPYPYQLMLGTPFSLMALYVLYRIKITPPKWWYKSAFANA
jgi:hypothetical protein